MKHTKIGKLGEAIAARYMQHLGYIILSANIRIAGVEVDLLAQKDNVVYVVEVKSSVVGTNFNSPLDRIVTNKIHRLSRAADWYSREHGVSVSLLAISVCINNNEKKAVCEMVEL
jgi:putative endonuclease